VKGLIQVKLSPHFSPDGKALTLSLNPQGIFLSQKYTRLFHFFGKFLVNPNTYAIILPTGEKCGLAPVQAFNSLFSEDRLNADNQQDSTTDNGHKSTQSH